jgi:hypothetical protein
MTDVPPTQVVTVATVEPDTKRAADADPPWIFIPFILLAMWTAVMSGFEHRSIWWAIGTFYGLFIVLAAAVALFAPHLLQGNKDAPDAADFGRITVAGYLLVGGWVLLVGSHGWWWDLLAAYVAAGATMLFFMRPRKKAEGSQPFKLTPQLLPKLVIFGSLAAWAGMSAMDFWFHRSPAPHDDKRFESFAPPPRPLAVALSGGGYRAVLYHAGVLHALEQLGVRPTHMSSVSGGSIIAAFYARGGAPRDLLQAVAGRRFNLKRDLADLRNAPRLAFPMTLPMFETSLFPWWSFSRLEVQANLLDDLLLGGDTLPHLYPSSESGAPGRRPRLMLNATDVNYGLGFGISADGFLLTSAARAAWIAPAFPSAFEGGRLARIAAISGAFPGAFPASTLEFDADKHPLKGLHLALADGGVLDNSGVRHLLVMNRLVRGKSEFCGDAQAQRIARIREADAHRVVNGAAGLSAPQSWKFDAIIASDAGKPFRPPDKTMTLLESEVDVVDRAVSLAGLHASVPVDGPCADDPAPIWLYPQALADVNRRPSESTIDHIAAAIPRTHFDTERRRPPHSRPVAWALNQIGRPQPKLLTDLCACETTPSPLDVRSLSQDDRQYLVDQIRDDIAQGVALFEKTSTLKDTFATHDAYALFRLGMYAVFEQSHAIRQAAGVAER